jgi:hypothetical protein
MGSEMKTSVSPKGGILENGSLTSTADIPCRARNVALRAQDNLTYTSPGLMRMGYGNDAPSALCLEDPPMTRTLSLHGTSVHPIS